MSGSGQLVGTRHLVRLVLRRDRIRLPVWLLGLTALTAATVGAVPDLYQTPEQIAGYGRTVEDSAAGRLLNGTPFAVDTIGGIVAYELTATVGVVVALMVTFLVVRHTRAEEESGRAEMLRGTVLGRHAPTAAVLLVAIGVSLVVGILDAAVLLAADLPTSGSVLHGVALGGIALAFTAVAAAAAQVTSSARGALGIAGGVIAVLFVVRGIGSVREDRLYWFSPFGWQQGVRAYGDERWWPVGLLVAFCAVVLAGTVYLTAHRDAGAGLLHPRPGRPRASRSLGTAVGLALRLQRGLLLGWATGLLLTAVLFGSLGREVVTMVETNPEIGELLAAQGDDIVRGFFAYAMVILCAVASAFTVSSALRVRGEEDTGGAEAVLATGLSRTGWFLGSLAVTLVGTLLVLLGVGVGAGGAHAWVSGDSGLFWPLVGAALAQAPAVLLVGAVAVLLLGWLPRWAVLSWVFVALVLVQVYLGELLSLPDPVAGLSPFWHLPAMPVEGFEAAPALVLLALAGLAAAVGYVGLRRRDIG